MIIDYIFVFRIADHETWLENTKSIILIKNKDQKCFPRAVAVSIAHQRRNDSKAAMNYYIYLRRGREPYQKDDADEIMRKAGLELHNGACGPQEWKQVENSLDKRYKLCIIAKDYCRGVVYEGRDANETLYLYNYDGHFAVITSMTAFTKKSYYCDKCLIGYDLSENHDCIVRCNNCMNIGRCINNGERIYCDICNLYFASQKCYDQHKEYYYQSKGNGKRQRKDAMCNSHQRCRYCKRIIEGSNHECFKWKCSACNLIVQNEKEHQFNCYMQPKEIIKDAKFDKSFIFYDFEANQDRIYEMDKSGEIIYAHDINFCIVHKVCDLCKYDKEIW